MTISSVLHRLSAVELARQIAAGERSPIEVARSVLDRIARLDPTLNAWTEVDSERVLADAAALAGRPAGKEHRGALYGVPVGIKDIYDVVGLPTRAGSAVLRDAPPAATDSAPVRLLHRAGALIIGKTATTEFASADPAKTVNPWNTAHTPGGSSSGSAAAVAAGMVPLSLGSQTAGSVLRPAAFCGIVGFKPSFGRVPRDGVLPFAWSLDTMGPLGRTVADVRLAYRALTGVWWAVHETDEDVGATRPPHIGYVANILADRMDARMRAVMSAVAARLHDAGATVEEAVLPADFELSLDAQQIIMLTEAAAYHSRRFPRRLDEYGPRIRKQVEVGALVGATDYIDAQRVRRDLFERVLPLLNRFDALLVPAAAGPAPKSLAFTGDRAFNAPWTLFGVPAVALFGGLDVDGLPLGFQLVARPLADESLLDTAAWCEQVIGPAPSPPAPFD